MKCLFSIGMIVLVFSTGNGQSFGDSSFLKKIIFSSVEVAPKFPEGIKGFYGFIADNLKFPQNRFSTFSNKVVIARIAINDDGRIAYGEIEKGINEGYNKAVLEALEKMPDWKPGLQNGKPVPVWVSIPILFVD